jgi:hypothetical protein
MQAFVFTCPATDRRVEIEPPEATLAPDHYMAVECTACGLIHLVIPETGEVMGALDD